MEFLEPVRSFFWNEWFWLPGNTTWDDLRNEPGSGTYYPQLSDLLYPFPCAVLLYIVRQLYEKFVVTNFGYLCGIKDEKPRLAPQNTVLDDYYKKKRHPNNAEITVLVKQTDQEVRQIERWFRMRRNQDRPTVMKKFTETGWRFTFYLGIFIYGLTTLWDKNWLWDSQYCWIGYPMLSVESSIFWYYMIELGFYWSLMFSQFLDVKRKDFWEMFIHHIATISLLSFSWVINFARVGTLVLCIHDSVDFWIEAAKMAKYAKAHRICDVLFAIFGLIWFVTRLVCYPLKILKTTVLESWDILGFWPSMVWFNMWMIVLLVLHVYWFSLIVRVAYAALAKKSELLAIFCACIAWFVSDLFGNYIVGFLMPGLIKVDDVRSESDEPVSEEERRENGRLKNDQNHTETKHMANGVVNGPIINGPVSNGPITNGPVKNGPICNSNYLENSVTADHTDAK